MNWTDERVATLKKLWTDGLSCTKIARQLGGVSRNAVVGKVHRLKLSGRNQARTATDRAKKEARQINHVGATEAEAQREPIEYRPAVRRVSRPIEAIVIPISRKLAIIELTENVCKWPSGDPLSEEFAFCGNEAGKSGPYCGYHSKIAYQPASERRRSR